MFGIAKHIRINYALIKIHVFKLITRIALMDIELKPESSLKIKQIQF